MGLNGYEIESIVCGVVSALFIALFAESLRRERAQSLNPRAHRSASASPHSPHGSTAEPAAAAAATRHHPPAAATVAAPNPTTRGSVAFAFGVADRPAAAAAMGASPPPPPTASTHNAHANGAWLSPPTAVTAPPAVVPGNSGAASPLLGAGHNNAATQHDSADPSASVSHPAPALSPPQPVRGVTTARAAPPKSPAAAAGVAHAHGNHRASPRPGESGHHHAQQPVVIKTFPYYCRRLCLVISALCAVWSVDMSGARGVYAYPGVLASVVVTLFFAVLSLWVYFHSLAILRQLGAQFPPLLLLALRALPPVYGALTVSLNIAYVQRDALRFAGLYEIASSAVVLCYTVLVLSVYVRLRTELHKFLAATTHVASPRAAAAPRARQAFTPQHKSPTAAAANGARDLEAGQPHASPTPAGGGGAGIIDTRYIEKALRTLAQFVVVVEVCGAAVLYIQLSDGLDRVLHKWDAPALSQSADDFHAADEASNFIAFIVLALNLWFSWPVVHPTSAAAGNSGSGHHKGQHPLQHDAAGGASTPGATPNPAPAAGGRRPTAPDVPSTHAIATAKPSPALASVEESGAAAMVASTRGSVVSPRAVAAVDAGVAFANPTSAPSPEPPSTLQLQPIN